MTYLQIWVAKRSQFCLVGNVVSNNVFNIKSVEYGMRWYDAISILLKL